MEKKYQVFVSSTYEDLQEERKKVMEALLQMNCFPVGMEYFNASDSSQWEVIKSLIRECDYYVLIVAGRYGSIEEESGKSYTQKEFEYAIEQGIPVVSFVHKDPRSLPQRYVEIDVKVNGLFDAFKTDVKKRLCKFWDNADGLAAQVVLSLTSLMKTAPRTGRVKANKVSSAEANKEILDLRKENQKLKEKLIKTESDELKSKKKLQQGEDKLNITYCIYIPSGDNWLEDKILETTWNSLFKFILPNLTASINNDKLEEFIESYIEEEINYQPDNPNDEFEIEIYEQEFLTIKMQMLALGLIIPVEKNGEAKWKISSSGYKEMIDLYSLKK